MSRIGLRVRRGLMLLSALTFCLPALATTVAELQTEGRLQLRSWLLPARDIAPGQQIKLNLEIATDRWFTGGTRIQIPEVPGLVILQTDSFASNSSEQRNGQSWVIQRWSLEIYPQREGNFSIPPINAQIKVSAESGDNVTGQVTGPALEFSVTRPDSLARVEHWVAAPEFSVSQSFASALEGLTVGDAIEREIVFAGTEVMAMMLPSFKEEAIAGLRAYPQPPTLDNSSNRGTIAATRTERVTYIIELEGEYQLPAQDYFWWDTGSGELQLRSLPTVKILVGAGSASEVDEGPSREINIQQLIVGFAGLLMLILLLWLGTKLPIQTFLRSTQAIAQRLWLQWRTLRKPALPARLNPGNSAED